METGVPFRGAIFALEIPHRPVESYGQERNLGEREYHEYAGFSESEAVPDEGRNLVAVPGEEREARRLTQNQSVCLL